MPAAQGGRTCVPVPSYSRREGILNSGKDEAVPSTLPGDQQMGSFEAVFAVRVSKQSIAPCGIEMTRAHTPEAAVDSSRSAVQSGSANRRPGYAIFWIGQ